MSNNESDAKTARKQIQLGPRVVNGSIVQINAQGTNTAVTQVSQNCAVHCGITLQGDQDGILNVKERNSVKFVAQGNIQDEANQRSSQQTQTQPTEIQSHVSAGFGINGTNRRQIYSEANNTVEYTDGQYAMIHAGGMLTGDQHGIVYMNENNMTKVLPKEE